MPTPLQSRFIDVDGLRLHYLEGGEGEPVLMLHGWPTSSYLYRNVGARVADGRRVLALDLPGFGKSDKPPGASYSFRFYADAITGFLDAVGVGRTGLVVHDLGGPVGLWWMVHNRDRTSSLVLLNTLVYPTPSWAVVAFVVASYIPGLRYLLASPWGLATAMRLGTCREDLPEDVVPAVQEPFAGTPARRVLLKAGHSLHPGGMKTIAEKLPEFDGPVRVVYGTRDRILPDVARTMARVARDLPRAEVTALDGCGHFLQEDRPDEIGDLLAAFFTGTREPGTAPRP